MKRIDYFVMPWYKKLLYKLGAAVKSVIGGIAAFLVGIPRAVGSFFVFIGRSVASLAGTFARGGAVTRLSFVIMGLGCLCAGQIARGLFFLLAEAAFIAFMTLYGGGFIAGLRTLGTVQRGWHFDEQLGIDVLVENGDNSMLILLYGTATLFLTILFVCLWVQSVHSSARAYELKKNGKPVPKLRDDIRSLLDGEFHKTLLFLPISGVVIFTIVPLVFMILLAFTNYDKDHQVPANLFTWVGLDNFKIMLGADSVLSQTFWPVLGWTLVWAVFATFLNYILGIILALLINKRGIRGKGFFRTLYVLAIAVPQFVSLLVMRNILAEAGPLNVLLMEWGWISSPLPFFTDPTWARVSVLAVNLWIGIPFTMLITSGILMNIPEDVYEAAKIDGASPVTVFFRITMPYVLFVTAPYLITQFIGNINNFNVIYFLTGGTPATLEYYQAGKTDLLITWLYKLTVNSRDYCYASTIGILVFIVCSVISLVTFRSSSSYKNEEAFQ
ncbi:MAG: carbohydrate ABC transporter permease [Oscillospiraceae bacterium]